VAFVDFIESHLDELAAMAAGVEAAAGPGGARGEE